MKGQCDLKIWEPDSNGEDIKKLSEENLENLYSDCQVLKYYGYLDHFGKIFENKFYKKKFENIFENKIKMNIFLIKTLIKPSISVVSMMNKMVNILKESPLSVAVHIREGDTHIGNIFLFFIFFYFFYIKIRCWCW